MTKTKRLFVKGTQCFVRVHYVQVAAASLMTGFGGYVTSPTWPCLATTRNPRNPDRITMK
jgi:hypothetical protein